VSPAQCVSASKDVIITVNPIPDILAPATQAICSGATTSISISNPNAVTGTSFGWTIQSNTNVTGASAGTGSLIAQTLTSTTGNTQGTVTYRITPTASSCSGAFTDVVVTVNPTPTLAVSPAQQTICSATAPNIVLTNPNTVTDTKYMWTVAPSGVSGASNQGSIATPVTGPISQTLTVTTTNAQGTGTYTITAVSPQGCVSASQNVIVTVNPVPIAVAKSTTVCSDEILTASAVTLTTSGISVSAANYSIAVTTNGLSQSAGTGSSGSNKTDLELVGDSWTNKGTSQVTVTYTVTPFSAGSCAGSPVDITVAVNPEPVMNGSLSTTVCSDVASGINLNTASGTVAANDYLLHTVTAASGLVPASGNATASSGSRPANVISLDKFTNTTNSSLQVVYRVSGRSAAGCLGDAIDVTLTVNPEPVVSAALNRTICNDAVTSLTFNTNGVSVAAANYDINTIILASGLTRASGNVLPGSGKPDNYAANDKFTNSSGNALNVVYNITPRSAALCIGDPANVTVTVNAIPVVTFSGFPVGSPPQVAENDNAITLFGSQTGGAFTISPNTSNIGSTRVDPSKRDEVDFDPSAVTLGSNFVTYTYSDGNGCTNFQTQEIFVNPVTSVDFAIQFATLSADGAFELCAREELIELFGLPPTTDGLSPYTQFISIPAVDNGPVCEIVKQGDRYFIRTNNINSGLYRIKYQFQNQFGAKTERIRNFRLFASPIAKFTSSNNCIASDVVFTDASEIKPTPFPTEIVSRQWVFGDGDFSTDPNPSKKFFESDTYYVTLKVTTLQGCSATTGATENPIRVGDIPTPDFLWTSICNNDSTKFIDKSNPGDISTITEYTWDFGDGDVLTGPADSSIPDGEHQGRTTGTYKAPNHKYAEFGTYNSRITVKTNDGCVNDVTKKVFILPYSTVKPVTSLAYFEDFETDDGGWIAEAFNARNSSSGTIIKSDTSWVWGIPNGTLINSGAGGSSHAWWTGKNNGSYFAYENSMVNGPCFDLSELNRPMISLDYICDTDASDGTVLQYSPDGGINWFVVGPAEASGQGKEGINWFNELSILANPGNQLLAQYGWTGTKKNHQGKWLNARFNMDMVPPKDRKQVRLRFAFASNDGNIESVEGFAFDNIFVGDKSRNVLIEHFTNAANGLSASQYLDNLYDEQTLKLNKLQSDFFKIQYHVAIPGVDELNQANPADPAARALYYGFTTPPVTIMDGIVGKYKIGQDSITLTGGHADIDKELLDQRALEDPLFSIDIVPNASASNVLSASIKFTYIDSVQNLSNPVIFHAALIETDVIGNDLTQKNVVRKLLLEKDGIKGITETRTWVKKQSYSIDVNYTLDVPVANPDNLKLVAFVQDKITGKIHQAVIVQSPAKEGVPPVAVADNPVFGDIAAIKIYPNPASKYLNFALDNVLTHDYGYEVIDQRGIAVLKGDVNHDLRSPQRIEIKDIANGVYFVKIALSDKAIVYRKVVVLNSH
jgi:hypothetical protein